MPSFLFPTKTFFACPLFFLEFSLSVWRYFSDPHFPRQDAAVAHLEFLLNRELVIWTNGFVSSSFGRMVSIIFANCPFPIRYA